ncbi:hypothetical protein [Sphingomonas sp. 3-13AW]|uniref:hypothetical protein n=1 Tax=Sphingomonas sp. 3-13AW TaxID=3050450 RepID=UPI003BB6C8E6
MCNDLVAISTATLATIPFPKIESRNADATLVSISRAPHGDSDTSMYEGFDVIYAGAGEDDERSILKPRFVALLRRRADGAVRLIRPWSPAALLEGLELDMMVFRSDKWMIVEAFSTHDITSKINASALCQADEYTSANDQDIRQHDIATIDRLSVEVRRAAKRVIDPALAERLKAYSEYLHAEQNNGHPATGSRNSPILG